MPRTITVEQTLIGAWEKWTVAVPDDAPRPMTKEWLAENVDKIEWATEVDSGFDEFTITSVDEEDE